MKDADLFVEITKILRSQKLGVLGTCGTAGPFCSLVGFSFEKDLSHLFFSTPRSTRKYANLAECGKAALLVDNRMNRPEDLHDAQAVTVTGTVRELKDPERERAEKIHIERHPYLAGFSSSPTTAIFSLEVDEYSLVSRFQNVMIMRVKR
ncbi:MAG TPA: pyridoxamine 5'-phosphate oxidase family protein [Synergistales bacterium]|nr:pyridoxamine 5'-phosphate oxidase family protein [Synergistales bacterium]HRV71443.1 pyridoxamine 5'-phosphate oxidase family protein [Thermovirgaceae bacterium]